MNEMMSQQSALLEMKFPTYRNSHVIKTGNWKRLGKRLHHIESVSCKEDD